MLWCRTSPCTRPGTVVEACDALGRYEGEARVIAGGTALVLMIHQGLVDPPAPVRLDTVAGLAGIAVEDLTPPVPFPTKEGGSREPNPPGPPSLRRKGGADGECARRMGGGRGGAAGGAGDAAGGGGVGGGAGAAAGAGGGVRAGGECAGTERRDDWGQHLRGGLCLGPAGGAGGAGGVGAGAGGGGGA